MSHSPDRDTSTVRRVGIDARLVYQTGVGVYIRNLLYRIATTSHPDLEFHVFARSRDIISIKDLLPDRCQTHFIYHVTEVPWHSLQEQVVFLAQIVRARLDLVHFPYFSWPILYPKKFVATVHDTILLTHATGKASTRAPLIYWLKQFVFRFVLAVQLHRARRIIVPSKTVSREISGFVAVTKGKTDVFYEGVDRSFLHAEVQSVERLINTDFLLYVGNCYPHKNVETVIEAFDRVVEEMPHAYLCLVGPHNTFSERIRAQVFRLRLQRSVVFFHDLTVSQLKWLYTNARALVFPSRAEGFGLPIVEAAQCDCPMIVSDIPIFHEVIGDHVSYVGLYDVRAWADHMSKALTEKSRPTYTIDPQFSFDHMSDEILKVYREVLNERV